MNKEIDTICYDLFPSNWKDLVGLGWRISLTYDKRWYGENTVDGRYTQSKQIAALVAHDIANKRWVSK